MEPILGQICLFGFTFAPKGWALCEGQLMSIAQNTALFSLLGTTYGGDGRTTFGLPDLRGRVPMAFGQGAGLSNHVQGQMGGAEQASLTVGQMPAHSHPTNVPAAAGVGSTANPVGNIIALQSGNTCAVAGSASGSYGGVTNAAVGGNQPISLMQPYTVLNYCIALQGIYPS
ncbi:MAG: tail fiber protein, partial [Chitinophagaceae bacterium]